MKTHIIEQGTAEWLALKRGKISGTRLESVMGTPLVQAQLIAELIAEEATETNKTIKPTDEMKRGTDEEPIAVAALENYLGKKIDRSVGFCVHDDYDWLGYSPDGILGKDMVEIKNPDTKTLFFYQIANEIDPKESNLPAGKRSWAKIPQDYQWQIVCGFLVNSECQTIHFAVHDSRILDEKKRLYVIPVERSNPEVQAAIKEADARLQEFRFKWLNWRDKLLPSNF